MTTAAEDLLRPDNREPAGSAVTEMQQRYRDARSRLMNAPAPAARQERSPRPVSPFVQEAIDRRRRAAELLEKCAAEGDVILESAGQLQWRQIVRDLAKKHGLRSHDLMGLSRQVAIVRARNEAFYRIRNEVKKGGKPISLPQIGRRFGDRDHTTVLHGIRQHAALLAGTLVDRRYPEVSL